MELVDRLLDKIFPSLSISKLSRQPWLKRDYKTKEFWIPLQYLINHLYADDKMKLFDTQNKWQNRKKNEVRMELEQGKEPQDFEPVLLTLHRYAHEFRVGNGISRIAVFREKKIPAIKAVIQIGEW